MTDPTGTETSEAAEAAETHIDTNAPVSLGETPETDAGDEGEGDEVDEGDED